jgi:hypothetical protein
MKKTKNELSIVGYLPSAVEGEQAKVYRFYPLVETHVIRAWPNGIGAVFSCFARTVHGSDTLRVVLKAPHSSQTRDFPINERWQRIQINLRNEITVKPLDVFLISRTVIRTSADIAIAFPQIEEALFATSPIPPDIQLPVIGKEGEKGGHRDADRVWLDKEKTGLSIDSDSATVVITADSIVDTDQFLETSFHPVLSFWSSAARFEVAIGISGKHGARFVVRNTTGEEIKFVGSDIIAGKQKYFLCAVLDHGTLSVVINGAIAIVTDLEGLFEFDRTYIGSSHTTKDAFNGYILRYAQFGTPLLYPRLLYLYRDSFPDQPQHTLTFMLLYFRYSLTTENENATFDACLNDKGFSYFISQLDFAVPQIYEQFPPGRHFIEEELRDWVMALMRRPGVTASRESYSRIGRTDLTLTYLEAQPPTEKNYRIEFKIWGRAGYNESPSQPLKYMTESELAAAFIMVDRRAHPNIADFERLVLNSAEFSCLAVKEIPILKSDLRYFISFHQDARYRMARMMINIYVPIAEKA